MWKYVFAVTLLMLLWGLVGISGAPMWSGAFGTLCVAVGVGAWMIVRATQARQAAGLLAQTLGATAALADRPQHALAAALATWSNELPAAQGGSALAALPWYWVLGPSAAGKSALVRGASLHLSAATQHAPVAGPTTLAAVRFWLSREAVLVESEGAPHTENDLLGWHSLLDSLRQHRRDRPLNGVLLTIPATFLQSATIAAVRLLAVRLRQDMDTALRRLHTAPPVYIVISQCDGIAGFAETFHSLTPRLRDAVWGTTLAWPTPPAQIKDAVTGHWEELMASLRQRSLERLAEGRSQLERDRIFAFPAQFSHLRQNFLSLVGEMTAPDATRRAPSLRGFFCTAAAPTVSPATAAAGTTSAHHAPSFFVVDLFRRRLAADRSLWLQHTRAFRPRQQPRRWQVAACLAALAVVALPTWAYRTNRAMVLASRDVILEVANERGANRNKLVPPASLERLRQSMHDLTQYAASAPPLARHMGMYQGDLLLAEVRRFYLKMLQDELVGPILIHDVQQMHNFAQRYGHTGAPPSGAEYKLFFDKLKTHLLLTVPRSPYEMAMGEAERAWLIDTLVSRWSRALSTSPDPAVQAQMGQHVAFYLEHLRAHPELCPGRDPAAVSLTRGVLSRLPPVDARLEAIIADAEDYGLGLPQLMGDIATPVRSDVRIRGGFTRRGWENLVRARLNAAPSNQDAWVLGRAATVALSNSRLTMADVKARYWARYAEAWRGFLLSLQVSPPRDAAEALAMVRDLTTASPPPYQRIVQGVGYNTRVIPGVTNGAADKAAVLMEARAPATAGTPQPSPDGASPSDNTLADFIRFGAPSGPGGPGGTGLALAPIDLYQEQLMTLRGALEAYMQDPSGDQALWNELQQATRSIRSLLDASEHRPDRLLQGLLWAPIELITQSIAPGEAASG